MKIKTAIIHALGGMTQEEHKSLLLKDRPKPEISFYTQQVIPLSAQTTTPKPNCLYNEAELQHKLQKNVEQKLLEAAAPYIRFMHHITANEHRCTGIMQVIPQPFIASFDLSKEEE